MTGASANLRRTMMHVRIAMMTVSTTVMPVMSTAMPLAENPEAMLSISRGTLSLDPDSPETLIAVTRAMYWVPICR